jgi:hypothetical protein
LQAIEGFFVQDTREEEEETGQAAVHVTRSYWSAAVTWISHRSAVDFDSACKEPLLADYTYKHKGGHVLTYHRNSPQPSSLLSHSTRRS